MIRQAKKPEELRNVLVLAFEQANEGERPSIEEIEQMFECVNTIREREGIEPIWIV